MHTAAEKKRQKKFKCSKFPPYTCYDIINKKFDDDSVSVSSEDDDWSLFGTLQVGYDRLLTDRFLIGVFADYDFYRDSDLTFFKEKHGDWINGKVERDGMWTIGGRLGVLLSPRILVYGLAGYSRMNLEGQMNAYFTDPHDYIFNSNPTDLKLRIDDNVDGWTAGGGLEAKLDKRWSLKFEYRWSHFGGASAEVDNTRYDSTSLSSCYNYNKKCKWIRKIHENGRLDLDDTDIHSVRAVLSLKLGSHEEPIAPLK